MNIQERESKYFFHTYKRLPLEIERGEGVYLISKDGRRYVDMFGGLAVNSLGYNHPGIIDAVENQIRKYIHLSNYYYQEPQVDLAELLIKNTGFKKVFFSNSGTEAVEGAIKIARKWGEQKKKTNIISFSNAFHGRTLGSLSLMDRPRYRDGFEPLLKHFTVVEYNNTPELAKCVDKTTLAVVIEFIQGEGGIIQASPEFVQGLAELREKYEFLLIADEIQTGLGRTGRLFSFEYYNIKPDIVVIAKPLGGGLPLGAILGDEKVADVLEPGMHGSTFGGNPVACAAGIVFIKEITEMGLTKNAAKFGEKFKNEFVKLNKEFPTVIKEVRGQGLMLGVELFQNGESIVTAMRDKGILINCTNQNVLRFLPPLIITEEHINMAISALRGVLEKAG
jgi:predicted acetylornithine/succinylornithine family transaminase